MMSNSLPQSILFCCDHNAVRSPMAEGIMKKLFGTDTYVQSVGVINDLEIDGFSIAVCEEIGVELSRHRSRSFDEMERWGDDLSSFENNSEDTLYNQAVSIVTNDKRVSISYIQRKLQIGYNLAARIVEEMEEKGIVSAPNTQGKRELL